MIYDIYVNIYRERDKLNILTKNEKLNQMNFHAFKIEKQKIIKRAKLI